jgi:hypothetical protein
VVSASSYRAGAAIHIALKSLACNVHYFAMNPAGREPSFVAVIFGDCRFHTHVLVQCYFGVHCCLG